MENLSKLFERLVVAFETLAENNARTAAATEAQNKTNEQLLAALVAAKDKTITPASEPQSEESKEEVKPKEEAPKAKKAAPAKKEATKKEEAKPKEAPAKKEAATPAVEYRQLSAAISELHAFSDEGAQAAINILKEYKVKNARFIPEEEWPSVIDKARNALEELIRIEEDEEDEDILSMDLSEETEDDDDDFDFGDDDDDFDFDEEDED